MNNHDLYIKLKDAYSDQNLNSITSKIIELYRIKKLNRLKELIDVIAENTDFNKESINKCFSKLIFMYHPDKGHQYRQEIETFFKAGETEKLQQYSHILVAQNIESMVIENEEEDFDIDYAPEYVWDEDVQGFEYFDEDYLQSDNLKNDFPDFEYDNTFFSAIKRKYFGNIMVDLPIHYLDDLEEIEMTNFDICDLSGAEYCRQVVFLDLSNNCITDVTQIIGLSLLEELYLSDNEIGYIDALSNLTKLRIIDLSNNAIDDLSPLFELPNLEYVNIMGNPIPHDQIEYLENNNVLVVC